MNHTQAELAAAIGVSLQTVFRFETGKHDPYTATEGMIRDELERRGIEFSYGYGAGVRISYAKAAEFARLAGSSRSESAR